MAHLDKYIPIKCNISIISKIYIFYLYNFIMFEKKKCFLTYPYRPTT